MIHHWLALPTSTPLLLANPCCTGILAILCHQKALDYLIHGQYTPATSHGPRSTSLGGAVSEGA